MIDARWELKFKEPGVPITLGERGYNENGVPLGRCSDNEQNAHYWNWIHFVTFCDAHYWVWIEFNL